MCESFPLHPFFASFTYTVNRLKWWRVLYDWSRLALYIWAAVPEGRWPRPITLLASNLRPSTLLPPWAYTDELAYNLVHWFCISYKVTGLSIQLIFSRYPGSALDPLLGLEACQLSLYEMITNKHSYKLLNLKDILTIEVSFTITP